MTLPNALPSLLLLLLLPTGEGFISPHSHARCLSLRPTLETALRSSSSQDGDEDRRGLIKFAALGLLAAGEGIPFFTAVKNKADGKASSAVISQIEGTFRDPNHPRGYRTIRASVTDGATPAERARAIGVVTVEMQDEPSAGERGKGAGGGEVLTTSAKLSLNSSGSSVLLFDFSKRGGPSGVPGVVGEGGTTISFPDGNTWTKI